MLYESSPTDSIQNNTWGYSLINSIAFHPHENLFCAAYSSVNQLINFGVDPFGQARVSQVVKGNDALLDGPQHVVFSRDGQKIIAVNWSSEAFTIYQRGSDGLYASRPLASTPFPAPLAGFKPHGMDVSPSGGLLAVAFGWTSSHQKTLGLFRFDGADASIHLLDAMPDHILPGIPKGIAFSPDERCLLVTYADLNCICIYDIDPQAGRIHPVPRQRVEGEATGLCRPEDIKVARDGRSIIVSNSGADCVTFYAFDPASNRITAPLPVHALANPDADLRFPHGMAFSPNGDLLVVSQFGPLPVTSNGDIIFDKNTPRRQARINIYRHPQSPLALQGSPWRRSWSALVRLLGPR